MRIRKRCKLRLNGVWRRGAINRVYELKPDLFKKVNPNQSSLIRSYTIPVIKSRGFRVSNKVHVIQSR